MRPICTGYTVVALLSLSTAISVRADESTPTRDAIAKSLALLQASSRTWIERAGCASCHHQSLPAIAFALGRARGFAVDEEVEQAQATAVLTRWGAQREGLLQDVTGDIGG